MMKGWEKEENFSMETFFSFFKFSFFWWNKKRKSLFKNKEKSQEIFQKEIKSKRENEGELIRKERDITTEPSCNISKEFKRIEMKTNIN